MAKVVKIRGDKEVVRRHYIPEWAERRHLAQADIVREMEVDKGLVSRWFAGTLPGPRYLKILADLFNTEPEALFRHPSDDWLAKFFKDRSDADREQAQKILEAAFPPKAKQA